MVGGTIVYKIHIKLNSALFSSDPLNTSRLIQNNVTSSTLMYTVNRSNEITDLLIVGHEVIRFGVPMIGEYVNAGTGRRVTISPAVPGAQYRITAWALGAGRRSTTPAVKYVTTGEASETTTFVMEY